MFIQMQSHAHIVRFYGLVVNSSEMIGTLMEHCEGGSLDTSKAYFRQKRQVLVVLNTEYKYAETEQLCWMAQAASGLVFLHRNNIVHRDIKPAK